MKFILIEEEILEKNLSDGAFKLYVILMSYCYGYKDSCYPSEKTLAKRLKRSLRSVTRYIKELREKGAITVIKREGGGNEYKIIGKIQLRNYNMLKKSINNKADRFIDYQQRSYDYDKLEKYLLGLEKDIDYGECIIKK
ncbi:helix-turn-helix domain-containing protein [Clostridium rectalis]|uniref:helix-turn-helix domain-containing protein n=1 Tax=Clostridium rectalis TaxID=2040295 RepID=UPI000F630021|nr:helix-turn-helix domain-containing protein [Clostridium rectalis]